MNKQKTVLFNSTRKEEHSLYFAVTQLRLVLLKRYTYTTFIPFELFSRQRRKLLWEAK